MPYISDGPRLPAGARTRLPSLTGMRFIAAMMVFALHAVVEGLFTSPTVNDPAFRFLSLSGGAGVGFFFILSGFVLTWSARDTDTLGAFWRRRLFKIYPSHLLTYLAAVLVLVLVVGQGIGARDAVLNALLLQSFFPSPATINSINPVAWSLSCELLFYLCFPALLMLVRRIRAERLWMWTVGVVAAVFAVPLVALALPEQQPYPVLGVTEWQTWFIYHLPPVRMLDFLFGILLARMVLAGRRIPLGFPASVVLAVVVFAVTPQLPPVYGLVSTLFVPLGLVIANGAVADRDGLGTGLSGRTWVWLGEVSFAFYLFHRLVLTTGHHLLDPAKAWDAPVALALSLALAAVTLVISWLSFSLFERPVMRKFAVARGARGNGPTGGTEGPPPPAPSAPVPDGAGRLPTA
ncbi:MAG TPA: acyltransferase [Streptomyces sp.]|uniref:acyltransferase family protein n=1 Tax=Streptomyces sp. TaxID=1931 RepID=UPI002C3908F9|nr:acyltransferase [Streptomyces sp.]HWU10857.1 acyltransferase [Streptomyces sp.]